MADRHRRGSRRIHEEDGLREHHDDVERGHRSLQREPEHHLVHEAGRTHSRGRDYDAESLRSLSRGSRLHEEQEVGNHRAFHGSRTEHEPVGDSELRRRQTREHLGGAPNRRSRHERSDGALEMRSDNPLPPNPAPVDFPLERSPPQNGHHGYEEHEPEHRSALHPTENALHRDRSSKQRADEAGHRSRLHAAEETGHGSRMHAAEETGHGSRMHTVEETGRGSPINVISTETFPHVSRSRLTDSHPSKLRSGSKIQREKSLEAEGKKSKSDELRRRSGEGRFSSKRIHSYSILKEEEEGENIERHASVLLPVLEDSERMFHELVAAGDIEGVRIFLDEHPGFNINCTNYLKISALHVAVKQQNEAMVEFLLKQKDLDISDCALYAIKAGNIKIVEMILDEIRAQSPRLEFAGPTHSADFSDDMTPIILAAQLGNYEIINFLIKRGHSIPPVHPPFCKCEACKNDLKKYDRLRYSTMKLNLYKAICNPMYIFQTTDDPFQRAFELVQELQDAAMVFPQFKVSFEELWKSLRQFTTDLIGCCRNAEEVEIVLKKSPKSVSHHVKFPRLQLAIDLKQKEFVSHPYTQAVLGDAWTGDLLEWKIRSPLMQSLAIIPRIPMLPIMTVVCIFLPTRGIVKKWKTPVNKMISNAASYLIFLIILFLESNINKKNQKRGPPNSGLEGVIIIYVIGYIWLNIRICFKQGIKRFFSTMWHCIQYIGHAGRFDTIMLFLFTMTIVFWIASYVDITANGDIDLPRKYWNALDPELIAEGFFAAAVIMAFFRLNLFLSLNYHLGPLQVSIGKMTLDIFRFVIIFSVIIVAWCAGLCRFYQPYEGMVQKDATTGTTTAQVSSFVNFSMTLKTLFWAIFGMSPFESADVIIENLPGDTPDTTIINKHQFTEIVGYVAFALFQFLSVVVVLNMLVACMANTFTKVIDNVTVEWVFGRSQIYLSFMASSILPPPFNLVPTLSGVRDVVQWFRLLVKSHNGQRAKCSFSHCCYIESETEAYVNTEFPILMSELAQRYIRLKSDIEAEEPSNELDEVKNDLNDIKETLRKLCIIHKC